MLYPELSPVVLGVQISFVFSAQSAQWRCCVHLSAHMIRQWKY